MRIVGRSSVSANVMCALLTVLLLGCAASTADDRVDGGEEVDGGAPGDAETQTDAGPSDYTSRCDDDTDPRAVVMIINGAEDAVAVYRLEDGALEGPTLREVGFDNPRRLAVRSDGREAVIAYGGFGDPYGVIVLAFERDGSEARIVEQVEVGVGQTPFGIAYASDDLVALATAGPEVGLLFGLERSGESFVTGSAMNIPGNWPLEVVARAGREEVVLARANLANDDAADVYRVARTVDAWEIAGESGAIAPPSLDIAIHPDGETLYSPSSDPESPVSVENLGAPGVLHVLGVAASGIAPEESAALPGISSRIAIHPDGHFLLFATSYYEVDPSTGTPIARSFGFTTVPLGDDGKPLSPIGPGDPQPVLLFNSLAVAASGHAVTAREQYRDTFPEEERHPVTVWAQPGVGAWEECQTLLFDGQVQLALAP